MPFSWTETKENTMCYIHENTILHSLFFNPFVLCIILVFFMIVIQYIFDKQYEEEDCSYLVTFRQSFVMYIVVTILMSVHDILIKNKYREEIKTLKQERSNQSSNNDSSITQPEQRPTTMQFRRTIDANLLNKMYQEE